METFYHHAYLLLESYFHVTPSPRELSEFRYCHAAHVVGYWPLRGDLVGMNYHMASNSIRPASGSIPSGVDQATIASVDYALHVLKMTYRRHSSGAVDYIVSDLKQAGVIIPAGDYGRLAEYIAAYFTVFRSDAHLDKGYSLFIDQDCTRFSGRIVTYYASRNMCVAHGDDSSVEHAQQLEALNATLKRTESRYRTGRLQVRHMHELAIPITCHPLGRQDPIPTPTLVLPGEEE